MCCRQWYNIECSSSEKWHTPRISVRAPPVPNTFELLRYGKEQEIKSATTYKSYDDSNIDDKEHVRDLGIMMSNTTTFTLHIRNIVKKARQDGVGGECFSHGSALSCGHS